jgi:hypothetical protein
LANVVHFPFDSQVEVDMSVDMSVTVFTMSCTAIVLMGTGKKSSPLTVPATESDVDFTGHAPDYWPATHTPEYIGPDDKCIDLMPETPSPILSSPAQPTSYRNKRRLDPESSLRPTKRIVRASLLSLGGESGPPFYRRDFERESLEINREYLKVNQEMLKTLISMQKDISHIRSVVEAMQ